MATKRKPKTKKDLESKIADLEAKLSKLSSQVGAKSAPKPSKPAEPKPTPKPAETKPAEPKPESKPAEPKPESKPAEPKPEPAKAKPPASFQDALENAYRTAPMSDFHQYRAKVTGYAPAPNRYFVRLTAPVGTVPTSNWNEQKAKVTGYTQPSNQYFATRQRLAYHPPEKTFGSFGNSSMNVQGVELKPQTQAPPPPPKPDAALPKETQSSSGSKSKQESLAEYEADYLKRLDDARIADENAYQEAVEEETKRRSSATHGSLPKGFSADAPKPETPKASKGTLPKGF